MNSTGKNPAYQVDGVLVELADGADLERLMESRKLSALEVMNMMRSKRGRELIKARRRLAKIHRDLLASRFAAFAVQRLCGILQQEKKPELWLKAAGEVLEAVKGPARGGRRKEREEEDVVLFSSEEGKRLMRAVCAVLAAEEKGKGA